MDFLDMAELRAGLAGTRFSHLQHFASIDSTSTQLLAAASSGAPEGAVYLADEQTAGRGRGAHRWHSSPGDGLYLSALVRPALALRDALLLSLAAGLDVWQAVTEVAAVDLDLRWPNDLMVGSRKCGGVLIETAAGTAAGTAGPEGADKALRHAVIGIGLNVHHAAFPPDLAGAATSLRLAAGSPILRTPLAAGVLRALDLELRRLEDGETRDCLLARFAEHSTWLRGKRVAVPEQGGYTGVTAGLSEHGFLLVDADDGHRRTVLSGGVRAAP